MNKSIVVTGIGMVGPFGAGTDNFWKSITEGRNLFRAVTKYVSPGLAGEISDFDIKDFAQGRNLSRFPMVSQYALASAVMAISDAGVQINKTNSEKTGIIFGTGNGPIHTTEKIWTPLLVEKQKKAVDPFVFQEAVYNAPAGLLSIFFGIKGPCLAMPVGHASSSYAISAAINYLNLYDDLDCILVVASDELSQLAHDALSHFKIVSPNDGGQEMMRPFDRKRNGFVFSEGAVTMVLERKNSAIERGSSIYGEIIGNSMVSDAYRIADNNPDGSGLCRAMRNSMSQAEISPEDIDYVVSSALSLKTTDTMEVRAAKSAFGKTAYNIPISSIKSTLGQAFGVEGLFNLAAGFFAIRDGIIPPTVNYQYPDDECDLDIVPNRLRTTEVNTVLSNSFSWGGIYSSIIIRRSE
jgi:3-oxoacyl-[acyl-carrier-protein] synthase II